MLHYAEVMKNSGPLAYISCMRFQTKRKESKVAASFAVSRKNIAHTLSFKHQLKQCYNIINSTIFQSNDKMGPTREISVNEYSYLNFPLNIKSISTVSWINVNSIMYKQNLALFLNNNNECPEY